MKNVFVLPTDKPSRVYLIKSNNRLGLTSTNPEYMENFGSGTQNQYIYITSDEEINEGDWFYDLERSHMFGATITKVMTSTDGKINVWGTGEESRDLLYVEDLVKFVDAAITKQTTPYELFTVGVGKAVKVKDVIKKIIEHSGCVE